MYFFLLYLSRTKQFGLHSDAEAAISQKLSALLEDGFLSIFAIHVEPTACETTPAAAITELQRACPFWLQEEVKWLLNVA